MIMKRKKRIAAWAVTATSAAFEISLVIWPDVIQHHGRYAFGLWAVAIFLWMWSFVTPQDEKIKKATNNPGICSKSQLDACCHW